MLQKKTFCWALRLRLIVLHKIEWNLESSQENHIIGFVCTIEAFAAPGHAYIKGPELQLNMSTLYVDALARSLRGDSITDWWLKPDCLRDFVQTNEKKCHFNE
jgi:hypothetical protein